MNGASWQIAFATYALMAPLVMLHTRWVIERRCAEDPTARIDTEQTMAATHASQWGMAAVAGLAWPLLLVGYLLSLVGGHRGPSA